MKRIKRNLLPFFIACSTNVFSQPIIQWQKTVGGTAADELWEIEITTDGGTILGGYSKSNIGGNKSENCFGGNDFWIVKLDSSGVIEWDRTYGGSADDELTSLSQTADGGYILGGRSQSDSSGNKTSNSHGIMDIWVVKIDGAGNIEWQKTIGGNDDDDLRCIRQTFDKGYILGGSSLSNINGDKTENRIGSYDLWILKLDSLGNIIWQNTIGGTDFDFLESIEQTADSGYIAGSTSYSPASGDKTENNLLFSSDYWILKLNSTGSIEWQNTIGGNDLDEMSAVIQTSDGGYFVAGSSLSNMSGEKTENNRGDYDFWVIKLDLFGAIQWQRTLGGSNIDWVNSISQTQQGDFVIGGYSSSDISGEKNENSKGFSDYWLYKVDVGGVTLWQKTIGGDGDDELRSIKVMDNNRYIFSGSSLSGISGDKSEDQIGLSDFWILKTSFDTGIKTPANNEFIKLYPNPTVSYLIINTNFSNNYIVKITDSQGTEVKEFLTNDKYIFIDLKEFKYGLYFIAFEETNQNRILKKFIKIE